jgi:hypothetical protein
MQTKKYLKEYYQRNKEQIKIRSKANYLARREEILKKSKENHLKNKERHNLSSKIGHYRRNFGISLEERNHILSQGCQICTNVATHIDHNHITGKVRGGLCNNCNTGLGMFNDNRNLLIKAAEYLYINDDITI